MVDQIYDRDYQSARHQLNADIFAGLTRLLGSAGRAMAALHRRQWDAPWRRRIAS